MEWNTKWNMGMEYEMEYGIGIWEWNMGMEYKMKYKMQLDYLLSE